MTADAIKFPEVADSISEGTLKIWSKRVGDTVNADEEVVTIETDKVDVSVHAPRAGKIVEILAGEEDTVCVGQDLFRIEYEEFKSESKSNGPMPAKTDSTSRQVNEPTPLPDESSTTPKTNSPRWVESGRTDDHKQPSVPATRAKKDLGSSTGNRNETRVKMSTVRTRIAERLKDSQNTTAFLTTFQEIDMSILMGMREGYKDAFTKEYDVGLGYIPAFARAVCIAVKDTPVANASIDGDEIVYRGYVDLSVTVASSKGLVTPIIRNAESMSFIDFEQALIDADKARDDQLALEDLTGGTFTINDGGVSTSLFGQSVINAPQSAALSLHAIQDKVVVVDGQIVVRPVMMVALTYDHRLLDGREGTTFLVRVKEHIEDPRKMLFA